MGRKKQKAQAQKESKPTDLYFLLVSTVVIIPFISTTRTMDSNLAPRLLALGVIVAILALINVFQTRQRTQFAHIKLLIFPIFGLYLLWSIFSLIQAVNPAEGTFDVVKTFLSAALLIYATHAFINYKNAFTLLVKGVLISAIIATSIGLFQYFDKVPGHTGYELLEALYEIKGFMGHKNQFAISLFLMLPFTLFGLLTLKKYWWALSLYTTLMILTNIVILQTRSVWVATSIFIVSFFSLWLIFFLKKRQKKNLGGLKRLVIVAGILVFVVSISLVIFQKSGTLTLVKNQVSSLFDSKSHNNQGRLKMWESTWNLSQDNLFKGVGGGNWRIAIVPYYQMNYGAQYQNWRRPHNDFLWVLSEKGIPALLFYLLLFIMVAIYGIKVLYLEKDKNKKLLNLFMVSGIIGYLVVAMFTFPLERINHQIYLMIMFAVVISIYYQEQEKPTLKRGKLFLWLTLLVLPASAFSIYYAGVLIKSEANVKKLLEVSEKNNQRMILKYADEAFTKFTTVSYNAMPIHIYKGLANISLKNYKQANKDLKTALGYFPTHIAVFSNLAIVSSAMNNNDKALTYLEKSLELYPTYEASLYNRANVYYRQKKYEKAYVALLSCNSDKIKSDYQRFMQVLKQRVDANAN